MRCSAFERDWSAVLLLGRGRGLTRDREQRGVVVVALECRDRVTVFEQCPDALIEHISSDGTDVDFDVDIDGADLANQFGVQTGIQVFDLGASGGTGGESTTGAIAEGKTEEGHVEHVKEATELAEDGDAANYCDELDDRAPARMSFCPGAFGEEVEHKSQREEARNCEQEM